MVQTKKRKSTSSAAPDFKRIKRKVGRKAPPPTSAVNTSFKSKTIQIREQSVVADKSSTLVTSKNLSIKELLSKLKHHNGSVRKDALQGLVEIIESFGMESQVKTQLGTIVTAVMETFNDEEKTVRTVARELLACMLQLEDEGSSKGHWFSPFFRLLMYHACAGLSSLQLGRRLDALSLVEILTQYFPDKVVDFEAQLVPLYGALLAATLSQVGKRKRSAPQSGGNNVSTNVAMQNSVIGISGRTGGILRNFKDSQKKNKSKAKPSTPASSQQQQGSSSATTANASSSDSGKSGKAGKEVESWYRVCSAFLAFLKHIDNQTAPSSQLSSLQVRQPKRGSNAFRALRPLNLDSTRILELSSSSGPSSSASSSASAASALISSTSNQVSNLNDASRETSGSDMRVLLYANSVGDVLSGWTHACVEHQNTSEFSGRTKTNVDAMYSTLEQMQGAAELVFLVLQKCSNLDDSQLNVAQLQTVGTAASKALETIVDTIPVKTRLDEIVTSGNARSSRKKDKKRVKDAAVHNANAPWQVTLRKTNLLLARSVLLLSSQPLFHDQLKESLVETAVSNVLTSLLAQVEELEETFDKDYPLEELFEVVQCAFDNEYVSGADKRGLDIAIRGFFDSWCENSAAVDQVEDLLPFASVLCCLKMYIERWVRNQGTELQGEPIPPLWVSILPRIAWQACHSAVTEEIASICFAILTRCALCLDLGKEFWDRVCRWLTPILSIQSKSTKEDVFGPFLSTMQLNLKLALLDLVAIIPVEQLPPTTLKALVLCVQATCKQFVTLTNDCTSYEARCLVISRLIQVPFLIFGRLVKVDCQDKVLFADALADIVSFAVSLTWISASTLAQQTGGKDQEALSILYAVERVCDHLVTLQKEHMIPIAHLTYPLLYQVVRNSCPSSPREDTDSGVALVNELEGFDSEKQQREQNQEQQRSALIERVLCVSRMISLLQCDAHDDSFPAPFVHSLALTLCYLAGTGLMQAEDELMHLVNASWSPADLLPAVTSSLRKASLSLSAKEAILVGWTGVLSNQRTKIPKERAEKLLGAVKSTFNTDNLIVTQALKQMRAVLPL